MYKHPFYGVSLIFSLHCSLVYKIIYLKDTAGMRAGDVQWRQKKKKKNTSSWGESLFWAVGHGGLGSWGTRVSRRAGGAGTLEREREQEVKSEKKFPGLTYLL